MSRPKGSKNKVPTEIRILSVASDPVDQQILQDDGARQAVASLAAHPGFRYLVAKLKKTRSFLRASFEHTPPTDLQAVSNLWAGIFWAGWLEQQVYESAPALHPQTMESTPDSEVAELFKKAKANLRVIGVKDNQSATQ